MTTKIKDLFKAVQNERVFISRFCNTRDRHKMVDCRCNALQMINDFEIENELSESMKRFLKHRICQAARDTGLM